MAPPMRSFSDIAEEFEKVELIEAVYEQGRRIAGRISLGGPRATVRRLIPSRRAISRSEIPSATNACTCAHSNALRTSTPLARHH